MYSANEEILLESLKLRFRARLCIGKIPLMSALEGYRKSETKRTDLTILRGEWESKHSSSSVIIGTQQVVFKD